ncbi:hypothetical protein [uncultured Porphyromonas sp.]|nr:hypothetical protein [uncultured Porphyromonas sp.]
MYHIRSSKTFEEDIKKLKKREAQVFQKALRLIEEVRGDAFEFYS